MNRRTIHLIRRSRRTIRRGSHQNHHCRRSSHLFHHHHWIRPCHHRHYHCRRFRSCRRFRLTSRPYSDRRCVSLCQCLTCRSPTSCFLNRCCLRLTSQNAPGRPCRLSGRLRRPFLWTASRRTRPARQRYHETTIRLPSFRMSCPTIHPENSTCSASPTHDPSRRHSTHDPCSGPPCVYPPAYFDCDIRVCSGIVRHTL